MKRLFALILTLALIIGCCPLIPLQADASGEMPRELTAADYAQVDLVFDAIDAAEAAPAKKNATDSQKTEDAMQIVMASDSYVEGSLVQSGNSFTWWTDNGIRCMYNPRMREIQEKQTPETSIDAVVNEPVATKGGSPQSNQVYLIGPYYGSDKNFTDQYKNEAQRVAEAIGDTDGYTLYSGKEATVDKVAEAISNGAVVFFDSHGATDYENPKNEEDQITGATCSYLCLTTSEGLTNADYNDGAAYDGSTVYINGETIVNHMTKNSPNGILWMAICLGMGTDGLHKPLRNKGVGVVYGYSESVTFQGDYLFEETFWGEMITGKTVAQAVATMKEKWGNWDWSSKIAQYYNYAEGYTSLSQARRDFIAFPVVVSDEDPWPGQRKSNSEYGSDDLQTVCSTYTLLQTCQHTNAYAVDAQPATCYEDGYTAGIYCPDCKWYTEGHEPIAACHQYENGFCTVCGEAQTPDVEIAEGGILIDPVYYPESSHNYLPGRIETQTFTCPDVDKLVITFSLQTKVEEGNDYISVYDGKGTQLEKFTGTEAAGKTVTIRGDRFSIKLESDFSVEYYGYSLSSIVAYIDACDHTFGDWVVETAATNTTTGSKYRVCTACGEREDKVIPQSLKVTSAALTLDSKIEVNFKCKVATISNNGYTDIYMVFDMNGRKVTVTEYKRVGDSYVFDFSQLGPHMMGDTIIATLYGTVDGELYESAPQPYSVKQYCTSKLKTATGAFKNLLIELLNYGASVQVYRTYKLDAMVNEGITGGLGEIAPYVTDQNLPNILENDLLFWKSGTVVLEDAVTTRVKFQAADLTGIEIKVSINGRSYTFTKDSPELKVDTASGANRYMLDINTIGAHEMRDAITFEAYKDGELVSETLTYSTESYAVKNANTTTNLGKVVNAMMKYGDATKAYRN